MTVPSERVCSEHKALGVSGGKRRGVGHAGKDNRLRVGAPSADGHCNVPSPQNPPWSEFSQPHAHPPRASACRYTHRGHLSAGAHARASCLWPHAGAHLTSAITAAGLRVRPWRPSTAWTASRTPIGSTSPRSCTWALQPPGARRSNDVFRPKCRRRRVKPYALGE